MATFSTNLALTLIGTGEQSGTWGTTTNTNLGTLLEQAISGYQTQACTGGTDTITIPDGADGVARNMFLELTGTGGGTLVVPAKRKLYFIYNNTSSAITVKVTGLTGVSVPAAAKVILVNNGTDIVIATNYMPSLTLGAALPIASGGTAGTTAAAARAALSAAVLGANGDITSLTGLTTPLSVAQGGTGAASVTANAAIIGNSGGTGFSSVLPSTSGNLLTSNGTIWTSTAPSVVASFSAGTTGFTPSTATTGVVTLAGTLAVANGGTGVTSSTGTTNVVLSNSPTLVTPALGTPSALVGTNITGTATAFTASNVTTNADLTGGVTSVGNAATVVTNANLTGGVTSVGNAATVVTNANLTGGVTSVGNAATVVTNANLTGMVTSVGNAASLGSFTSAQLLGALTDETGTGSAVFATSPTLVTPLLGTPTSGVATNLTGLPLTTGVTGTLPVANGGTASSTAANARTALSAAGSGAVGSSDLTMTSVRVLGRTTASTGAIEEITVGAGLTLSAGDLSSPVKAWVRFTVSATIPTIVGQYNVASITRNGTGDYTVTFTTSMTSVNYCVTTNSYTATTNLGCTTAIAYATGNVQINITNSATNGLQDPTVVNVVVMM